MVDADDRQGIQSVEIAMRVLLALEKGAGPMTLGDVAQRSGIASSKVHRYLVSLCRTGLAAQLPSGRYDYGPAMRRLGALALRRTDEISLASAWSPGLRDDTGHSVNLAVWGEDGPIVVRWDYGSHLLPLVVRVGSTLPLLTSSAGQVFLALLPEALTAHALRRSATQISEAKLRQMCATVRRTGVAVINDGVIPGISSISAPITTAADALPVVVSVVMPDAQVNDGELARVSTLLLRMTAAVSAELGAG